MSKQSPMIDDDGEVRELTAEDMRLFRPAADVLPADVLAALKASGKGWQTRVNEAVKDWLKTHSPA